MIRLVRLRMLGSLFWRRSCLSESWGCNFRRRKRPEVSISPTRPEALTPAATEYIQRRCRRETSWWTASMRLQLTPCSRRYNIYVPACNEAAEECPQEGTRAGWGRGVAPTRVEYARRRQPHGCSRGRNPARIARHGRGPTRGLGEGRRAQVGVRVQAMQAKAVVLTTSKRLDGNLDMLPR